MNFIGLKKSDYRKVNFKHPESTMVSHRWELMFEADNETFNPDFDEDELNCKMIEVSTYATSYSTSKEQNEDDALADIKKSILATHTAFIGVDKNPKGIKYTSYDRDTDIDMGDITTFIKNIYPDRTEFSIDDLDKLDQYRYLLYSTSKLIQELFEHIESGAEIFNNSEELMTWLTK